MTKPDDIFTAFASSVSARHRDLRIARVPSQGGRGERFLLAPASRFADALPSAQRARQADAGALPPEVYGEDLFEFLPGPVLVSWDGARTTPRDDDEIRALLGRWLDESTPEGRRFARCAERIRDGIRATERDRGRLSSVTT